MPRTNQPPKYGLYRPKNLAVVRIDGKDHYLGKYGSPESYERYHRLLAERAQSRGPVASSQEPTGPSDVSKPDYFVSDLVIAYWEHACAYYRKADGTPSGEEENIRLALRAIRKLYGSTQAADFGPVALKAVRAALVATGLARTTVNQRVGKIVRMFRWAVENELVPPSIHHALSAVPGLRRGRTEAPEPTPVRPVADAHVDAVRPFVTRQVWAMIELQRLTAARSGEIVTMRTGDLDRSGEVWTFRPRGHKTEHHGIAREIVLGPLAREIVQPWLRADPDAYLFQPREAVEEWNAAKRANRKSKPTPSQVARASQPRKEGRAPGERYNSRSFAHAIKRACERAGVPHWHPHQLRHAAATKIRAKYGLEAAQVVLGHSRADVSQVYAERDQSKARDVMKEIG